MKIHLYSLNCTKFINIIIISPEGAGVVNVLLTSCGIVIPDLVRPTPKKIADEIKDGSGFGRDEEGNVLDMNYPHLQRRRVGNQLGKATLSRPD
uniref:(California timema) hypothetical protein n=1 Tax=Timema californicum TaxID=61474 RepID=A0A7R9JA46_TIMCA|nr:unnamed protein product [Timema californicum]